jgi:hypothetical protein
MPIFAPDGRPLTSAHMVGAKKLADYAPLNPAEFHAVCQQLEEGLSAGIADHVPVTVPTLILARILQTARVAAGAEWKEPVPTDPKTIEEPLAAPAEAAPYLAEMPDLTALKNRVRLEEILDEEKQAEKEKQA